MVAISIWILWAIFWTYWSLKAFKTSPALRSFSNKTVWIRIVAFVVLMGIVDSSASHVHTTSSLVRQIIGCIAFASGLFISLKSRMELGEHWGRPMAQKRDPVLISSGPYAIIRHPIYTGILLSMLGTACAINWFWLIPAMFVGSHFLYSAHMEERYLIASLPQQYKLYQSNTKRFLPFVW